MASSADSKAIDMPLPVTGGIMVNASPTQHSFRWVARCGRRQSPATEQKESSSNRASATRECSTDAAGPPSQSRQRCARSGTTDLLRNKPQMFTSPPAKRHKPT